MSIKQLLEFSREFLLERTKEQRSATHTHILEERHLIEVFMDFIMKSLRDEYRAKGLKK